MQEFKEAMTGLNAIIAAEKAKIAATLRPRMVEMFQGAFAANPELESFSFDVSTDVYDDENYNDEVEDFTYLLKPEFAPDGYEPERPRGDHPEDGPLHPPYEGTVRHARGEFSQWDRYYRSAVALEAMKFKAQAEVAAHEAYVAKLTSEGYERLRTNVSNLCQSVEDMDIDFAKIVFGENVRVTVSRAGCVVSEK